MFPTSTMGTLSLSFTLLICSLRRTHATEQVANTDRSVQTDDNIQQARLKTCGFFSFIICRQNNSVGVATLAGFCVCHTFICGFPVCNVLYLQVKKYLDQLRNVQMTPQKLQTRSVYLQIFGRQLSAVLAKQEIAFECLNVHS